MEEIRNNEELASGTILAGKYLLEEPIGRGGFGITYRGKTLPLPGNAVAIKEFFPRAIYTRSASGKAIVQPGREKDLVRWSEDYERECALMMALRTNQAVVHVWETFKDPLTETQFLIMDFIPGETLEKRVQRGSLLSGEEVESMLKSFLPELAKMHQIGILHRDINPGNLMFSESQGLKLIDFGSARQIPRNGGKLTTLLRPGFAPPEQYDSRGPQSSATDVYALCASLYFALSGVIPPDGKQRMIQDELTPLSKLMQVHARPQLIQAIMQGLVLPIEDRIQTFDEMYRAIYREHKESFGDKPISASKLPPPKLVSQVGNIHALGSNSIPSDAKIFSTEDRPSIRAKSCIKAAKALSFLQQKKYQVFLQELERINNLPESDTKWIALEEAIWKNGKLFVLLTDLMTPSLPPGNELKKMQ
ncbi:MAG: serine/threonine protein kinase [Clostridia bacterium]|nr:serine/threonine protein kinase [Clostridia bacterium]